MSNDRKDLSYGMWAFNYISVMAHSAGMNNDARILKSLKYISMKSHDTQSVKIMLNRTIRLIQKSPGYIVSQLNNDPFQPNPPASIINGEIKIGYIHDFVRKIRYPFGISRNELNQHMLGCGRSGAGKTTVLILILSNLLHLDIPFWIFDFKRDYRSMIKHSHSMHVFNKNNFRFNPLSPPKGTEPVQWASIFTDIFFQNFYQGTASSAKNILLDVLFILYEEKGYINFNDLCNELNRMLYDKNITNNIKESIKTIMVRLKPFNLIMGNMVNNAEFDMEELLTKPVVLELDGLTIEYQTFIATLIFHWIFTYRLNLAQRGELRHLLLFDEAKRLFSLGIPLVGQLVSLAREFGQGLILADQMPSCLDHATLANVYATITLNLAAPRDISSISHSMGLNSEQQQALNSLPLKTAVVKLAGRYTRPFLIHVPELVVDKNISDSELALYMNPKLAALTPVSPPQTAPQNEPGQRTEPEPKEQNEESSGDLSENELDLLSAIKLQPYISATERLKSLHMTNYMGNRLYKALIENEFIKEHEVKVNYRGRPQKFYELKDKAIGLVGKQNLGAGKGGFVHRLHQHRLKTVFENQGYKVKIEKCKNGKNADLGLEKDGKYIAVEIAMSPQGEVSNIEKDLAAGWDEVWTLCDSEAILKTIQQEKPTNSQFRLFFLTDKQFF